MEKKPTFLFFEMAYAPDKDKTRHIAWLSSLLFTVQCFFEIKTILHLMANTI